MPPDSLAASLWNGVLTHIRSQVSEQQFDTWFRALRPGSSSDDVYELTVPNTFTREWIRSKFSDVILSAVEHVIGGRRPALRLVVREESATATNSLVTDSEMLHEEPSAALGETSAANMAAAAGARPASGQSLWDTPAIQPRFGLALNRDNRFRTFVTGPSNRVAVAAAQSVVERGARLYNPLCIYGGVGTGKTHLLQAIAHGCLDRNPALKVLWVTTEHFINQFIGALEKGTIEAFRGRFRDVDVLLVDDVQFFEHKERTQDEFLHTFNALHNAGRQIVLCSDREPSQLEGINERLRSRMAGGFVCALEAPDYEVRLGLVASKAERLGAEMPAEAAQFIAENVRTNARELEGAVTRVVGQAFLGGKAIDLAGVREVLRDVVVDRRRRVSMEHISKAVEEHYGVRLAELQGRRRTHVIALPRQVGMLLSRKLTGHSLEEIGSFFGGRDHSTVSYSIEKSELSALEDAKFKDLLERLAGRALTIAAA